MDKNRSCLINAKSLLNLGGLCRWRSNDENCAQFVLNSMPNTRENDETTNSKTHKESTG